MAYDNTNRGALFRNDKRETDTDADYNGTVNIDGTEYWLNGWLNTSKAGDKYISVSVRSKDAAKAQTHARRRDDTGGMGF